MTFWGVHGGWAAVDMERSGKCSAGVQDTARAGVGIPISCLGETEEIMIREKKPMKISPATFS